MRQIQACLLAAVIVVLVAGCGSSGSGSAPADPRLQALSYFPTQSPFVMTISTASRSSSAKQLQQLERANPSYALGLTALYGQLGRLGIDLNGDVRPLFGNPIVLGLASPSGSGGSLLVAWVTRSSSALHRIIGKLHSLHSAGSDNGASLYDGGKVALATSGATLVLGRNVAAVRTALDRSAHHGGISSAQYAADTAGVSSNGLFEAFGDLTGALSAPKAANARRVPWVAAIRRYGLSVGMSGQTMTTHFVLDTGGRSLTPSQLPLASGALGPALVGPAPIQAGIRDPAQFMSFVIAAEQESSPRGYAKFLRQAAAFRRASGVSVQELEAMLTGSLDVDSDGHATLARADVTDPAAVSAMLTRLSSGRQVAGLGGLGRLQAVGGGFYRSRRGAKTTYVGVSHGRLVIGNAPLASVRDFAAAAPSAPTQSGAISFRMAIGQLLALGLARSRAGSQIPPAMAQRLIGAIGNLTGSLQATTGGLSGTASVPLHSAALSPGG